jgi:acyl carrier protein
VAELLDLPEAEIDVDEPFADHGISSRDLVSLSGDIEDWLGRPLPPTVGWEYPTIAALARHLAELKALPPAGGTGAAD